MKSSSSNSILVAFAIANAAAPVFAQATPTAKGCYSSQDTLEDQGYFKFQTSGYCQVLCVGMNKPVFALSQGSHCYCGTELPPSSTKVGNDQCNINCLGYPQEQCGGSDTFQVFLSGMTNSVPTASNPSSSSQASSSPSTTNSPSSSIDPLSTVTQAPATVTYTAPGQAHGETAAMSKDTASPSSGANKAGIAAGVVVGLVAVGAMVGGAWLLIKHRRKRAVEEEYRRNVAINSITNGGKSPLSSA
jgi:cell wall integrity and stress response component